MKNILENLNLTRKSILILFVVLGGIIGTIALTSGFNDEYHIYLSSILISILFSSWVMYSIIVICLYYKLPKNRTKNEMGVLFIIDSHGNIDEYKSIKDKFIDNFKDLSNIIENNIINPVILSERNIKAFKNKIYKKDKIKNILLTTNCTFAVRLKATDIGIDSSSYELKLDTTMVHPEFNSYLKPIFEKNYNYIFKDLKISTIDKSKDLNILKRQSTQLYLICQLLFGVAKTYSGYPTEAMELLNNLLAKIEKNKDNFSENLKRILYMEIFADFLVLNIREYKKYNSGQDVDLELVRTSFEVVNKFLNKIQANYQIDFYLQKAIYDVWTDNLISAKNNVSGLIKRFNQFKRDNRIWAYSEAFLFACENNSSKYEKIIDKYKQLKNNKYPAFDIQNFIFRYSNDHPNNLGIKIALCSLVFYRDDLDFNIIPQTMIDEIIAELEQKNLYSTSKLIKDMSDSCVRNYSD